MMNYLVEAEVDFYFVIGSQVEEEVDVYFVIARDTRGILSTFRQLGRLRTNAARRCITDENDSGRWSDTLVGRKERIQPSLLRKNGYMTCRPIFDFQRKTLRLTLIRARVASFYFHRPFSFIRDRLN
jgi:hypothetical protein